MNYDIYFDETKIGTIERLDSDFPNLFGKIEFDIKYLKSNSELNVRLRKMMELSRRHSAVTEIEHEQDVEEELEELYQQEEPYRDLIESKEWYLIDESGKKELIFSPMIHENNEVTWRWNFKCT